MVVWFSHASGIIMSTAWAKLRPPEVEQLEHLVEGGRVAAVGVADGEQPLEVAGDEVAGEQRLAGPHPVPVAPQRVDLAVVGQEPVRMGQRPRREGVGREPGVHQGQTAVEGRVREVGEELAELRAGEHPLVDEGARRQRRHVDAGHLVLDPLAQAERQPVEHERVRRRGWRRARRPDPAGTTTIWAMWGMARRRRGPQAVGLDRDVAPPQDGQALLGGELGDVSLRLGAVVGVGGQEHEPHRVPPGLGEIEAARPGQETVRHLDEDAGPVAGGHLGPGGAAVRQMLEGGERLADEAVAGAALEVGHHGDPAGVVLEGGVVQGRAGVRGQMP